MVDIAMDAQAGPSFPYLKGGREAHRREDSERPMSSASLPGSAAPGGAASREASPAPVQRFASRAQLNPSLTLVASPSSQECLWDERQWLF
jgi:hypothetical protein